MVQYIHTAHTCRGLSLCRTSCLSGATYIHRSRDRRPALARRYTFLPSSLLCLLARRPAGGVARHPVVPFPGYHRRRAGARRLSAPGLPPPTTWGCICPPHTRPPASSTHPPVSPFPPAHHGGTPPPGGGPPCGQAAHRHPHRCALPVLPHRPGADPGGGGDERDADGPPPVCGALHLYRHGGGGAAPAAAVVVTVVIDGCGGGDAAAAAAAAAATVLARDLFFSTRTEPAEREGEGGGCGWMVRSRFAATACSASLARCGPRSHQPRGRPPL